jgi:hypothetical protein
MWENRVGEISQGSGPKRILEVGPEDPLHRVPAHLVPPVTRILKKAMRQYRRTLGCAEAEHRKAWIDAMTRIFKLLATHRLKEQHADIGSFHKALAYDERTTYMYAAY